jgi:hypothetical protein
MRSVSRLNFAKLGMAIVLLTGVTAARGEVIYGVTDAGSLFHFDSASPGAVTSVGAVTGLSAGHALKGIDFRPSNAQLYAVSNSGTAAQLYTVNPATAAATPVGAGFALPAASLRVSIDFNPVVDLVRVVTGDNDSLRVNPTTGALVATDTDTAYASGDPNFGSNPPLPVGVAYSNNFAGAGSTTLYTYDFDIDIISTIGSAGGSPTSPNTGQMFTIGASGIVVSTGSLGFDISGPTGIAYINADTGASADRLYTVNLATGALADQGGIGGVAAPLSVLDISAVIPEPAMLGLAAVGAIAVIQRRRR